MSMTRLSSLAGLNLSPWAQLNKTSSATPSTVLPLLAAPTVNNVLQILATLSSGGTTATAIASQPHGLQTGDLVQIAGVSLAVYNGIFPITVTTAARFTYGMTGTGASPAVGLPQTSILYFAHGSPPGGSAVTSITQAAGVATVTTPAAHKLITGDVVKIHGTSLSDYNGVTLVTSAPTPTTFTYAVSNNPVSPAVVRAAFMTWNVPQITPNKMLLIAPSTNAANISFGPNSSANADVIAPGTDYLIESRPDCVLDLSAWYFQSANASQALTILYL